MTDMKRFSRSYLGLIKVFSLQAFRKKDQNTWLGFIWTLISPTFLMTVLYFLFRSRFGNDSSHYAVYLLSGIIVWAFFSTATASAITSFQLQRSLVRNFSFPKEILPLASVGSFFIEYVIKLFFLVILTIWFDAHLSYGSAGVLVAVLLHFLFTASCAICLAFFYVYTRDLDHIWRALLQIGFFCTPIFYELETVSEPFRSILFWNPMTHMLLIFRAPLLEGVWPPFFSLAYCVVVSIGLFVLGIVLFKKHEYSIAERA